jgi:hypothetical protein
MESNHILQQEEKEEEEESLFVHGLDFASKPILILIRSQFQC